MLREHYRFFDRVTYIWNGVLLFIVLIVFYRFLDHGYFPPGHFFKYLPSLFIFAFFVTLTLSVRRFSFSSRFLKPSSIIRELLISYASGFIGYSVSMWAIKLPHLSRLYFFGSAILSFFLVLMSNLLAYFIICEARVHEKNFRNIVIVGNQFNLPSLIKTLQSNKALGLRIVATLCFPESEEKNMGEMPGVGRLSDLEDILNKGGIDYVFFMVYRQDPVAVEKAVLACRERGVEVWLKPDFMHGEVAKARIDYLQNMPLLVFSSGPRPGWASFMKRALDILFGVIFLAICGIPMLIIFLLIRRTSNGPALFKQKRIGLNGRKFTMYKFRTMYTDMEQRWSERHLKNEMHGPVFKMKNDPRVTPFGAFLRKYSMDELPQLWNVIKGDMSLVGPRPPLPLEVSLYKGWHRRRLSMRPGITCIWQVTGRNKITDFNEWVRMDLDYIDRWNLLLDFQILLKTLPAVLKGTGL